MKIRTAFLGVILSLLPLSQPLLIKTGVSLSTAGLSFIFAEKVNAELRNVSRFFKISEKRIEEGDYQGAISIIEKLIAQYPKFPRSYYQRGFINSTYFQKYDEAISDFSKAISLSKRSKSNLGLFYSKRGDAKREINDIQGACSDWREAMKLGKTFMVFLISQYC